MEIYYMKNCCCCCVSLRTGGKIIAILCSIYALVFLAYVIERIVEIIIAKPKPDDHLDQSGLLLDGFFYLTPEQRRNEKVPVGLIIDGVIFIVHLFFAVLLFFGAHKRKNQMIIPWLCNTLMFLIVRIYVQTVKISGSQELLTEDQFYGLIANEIITDLLYIYFWLVIVSLVMENKKVRYR